MTFKLATETENLTQRKNLTKQCCHCISNFALLKLLYWLQWATYILTLKIWALKINGLILVLKFKLWSQDIKVNKKCTNDINAKILNMVTG